MVLFQTNTKELKSFVRLEYKLDQFESFGDEFPCKLPRKNEVGVVEGKMLKGGNNNLELVRSSSCRRFKLPYSKYVKQIR